METILPICIGIGLSAACGFRLLVPFLAMGIVARSGYITLAPDMAWISSEPAIAAFAVAVVIEVLVYLIPGLDNLMDTIAVPAAAIAGTMVTAAFIQDTSPLLRWSLAAIAGGTAAGSTASLTSLTRLTSTATTAGVANPAFSIMELVSATILTVLAIMVPVLTAGIVAILLFMALRKIWTLWARKRHRTSQ